ncbi:hypothetical protein [Pseudomonas sp. TH08]|uniref:hypothetical protein n=1 Tax=Pseudomonas sp. TH08 TaxID=2796374 RepID=UPI001F5BBE46|nr:hypothetical protein [Pseudomonas sp. TH08]
MDIDHIPSRRALDLHLRNLFPTMSPHERRNYLQRAPGIAIPSDVHQKFSETYGGRNTSSRQERDALDIESSVNQNFNAIKNGLLEAGFVEAEIEVGRKNLHILHKEQGWY